MQVEAGDTTKCGICTSGASNAKALSAQSGIHWFRVQGIHLKLLATNHVITIMEGLIPMSCVLLEFNETIPFQCCHMSD